MEMYGNVLKIYRNVWKLMEIVTVVILTIFPFFVVWKMYGKSKEIYGKCMEMTKDLTKFVKIYGNVWKCIEDLWKCIGKSMEMHGNVLKI